MTGTQAVTPPAPPLAPTAPPAVPAAPTPRRLGRPRWVNVRVLGGVLVLVAAVVVGARVVGASAQTTPVWAADRDLGAGTVLSADDVVSVEVNLGDSAPGYLTPAVGSPAGLTLVTPLRDGELLPRSAVEQPGVGRIVAISVQPEHIPPGAAHGSTIDLYLTAEAAAGTADAATTDLIGRALTVQSVTAPASGGLSGATSNRYQVSVLLPENDADRLVRALPTGEPIVVLVSGPAR